CTRSRSSPRGIRRARRGAAPQRRPEIRSLAGSAKLDLDRRPVKAVTLADAVLEVARVGEVHRRGAVDEEHERGRRALRLGHVMETYLLAVPVTRRRMRRYRLRQQPVEVRRRNPLLALVDDGDGRAEGLLDAATRLRRDQPVIHPG